MAHSSDYKQLYVTAQSGLSIDEIRQALGKSSRDLGTLCQSDNINKWSRVKPVRYNDWGAIGNGGVNAAVEAIMKASGFGFGEKIFDGNNTIFSAVDVTAVFNRAVETVCDWEYFKPRGYQNGYHEPFRLLDFAGYNVVQSTCIPPISVDAVVSSINLDGGGVYRRLSFMFTVNTAAQIQMSDLLSTAFGSETQKWKYCVLIRKYGTTGTPVAKYGMNYIDEVTTEDNDEHPVYFYDYSTYPPSYYHRPSEGPNAVITLPSPTMDESGTYVIVPCLTRMAPGGSGNTQTVYLPGGTIYYDTGSGGLIPKISNFQVLRTTVTHIPTSQEVLSTGGGYFDATLSCSFTNLQRSFESWVRFKGRVKIGGVYGSFASMTRGGEWSYGETINVELGFTYANDYPLPCPVVPNFSGGAVFIDLYADDMPLGEFYLTALI